MMNAFFNGLMITGGLIVAIGAQNAFVLRQGLLKQHIGVVVALCWLCDVVLMAGGVFGISALLSDSPLAAAWLAVAGGVFLVCYGALTVSALWFVGLGYGARLLLPLFRRERVWQILDGLIAAMMFYLAYGLLKQAAGVLQGYFQTA